MYTAGHKNVPLYVGYNFRVSGRILTLLAQMEAGMNTLQCTYLVFLNRLVRS